MVDSDLKLLLLPVGLAVVFLLWVIWELEKQIRRERRRSDAIAQVKTGMECAPAGGVAADEQGGTVAGARNLQATLASGLPSGRPSSPTSGFRVAVR